MAALVPRRSPQPSASLEATGAAEGRLRCGQPERLGSPSFNMRLTLAGLLRRQVDSSIDEVGKHRQQIAPASDYVDQRLRSLSVLLSLDVNRYRLQTAVVLRTETL